jgi:broad specificity phosphatase PhoE
MGTHTPTRLIMIRHGQSVGNATGMVQGWTDSPLSPRGAEQARRLGDWMRANNPQADYLFSSPLKRAYATAQAVSDALGLEIQVRDGLKEVYLGELEDSHEDIFNGVIESTTWEADYGVEATPEFTERALGTLHGLLARYDGHTLIVVSHLGVIGIALAHWLDRDVLRAWEVYGHLGNASITEVRFTFHENVELLRQNELPY